MPKLCELPVSALAYIGDAVYELAVRERLLELHPVASGRLHRLAVQYVKAEAQAKALAALEAQLSEKELDLCRRAHNHHPVSLPKHAEQKTYRAATAFESLIGACRLAGDEDRLAELLRLSFAALEEPIREINE